MSISLVEASISDLQHALSTGSISSVELVTKYLQRISSYDCHGPCLNSIPILNEDVLWQAAASDARRASGKTLGPLDGIPYTLKDSMKYKGMTCSTGSPAFENLLANEDAFVVEQLKKAGAVCIGRTNTPPMMASGMHRGVHGRAESPYNLEYLTAAFSSGSSNGSATSTAASFAAFGLGSETVSSGRSPASNNGLVAYTPSRTMISPRGVWPLYPTCDVLVPHTRTVEDMLTILDVLTVADDERADGDFWREQNLFPIPTVSRPTSFLDVRASASDCLRGVRIAVPKMYIGEHDPQAKTPHTSAEVLALWRRARDDLEALGATVVSSNFPLVTNYEDDFLTGHTNNVVGFKPNWNSKERGELVAYVWDDFLKANGDPNLPDLSHVDGSQMFPRPEGYIPDRYMEHKNFINYTACVEMARKRNGKSIWEIDGIKEALPALEAQRKRDLEGWMDANGYDLVVFPANGDVGRADLDTNDESARHALQNGVKYSNGNRAIRHMGVPTVSVCMGMMERKKMPVNLTFAGKHGQDVDLLKYAYAFEQHTKRRVAPPVTPPLPSDTITPGQGTVTEASLSVTIDSASRDKNKIEVKGHITVADNKSFTFQIFVDGEKIDPASLNTNEGGRWSFQAPCKSFKPPRPPYGGVGKVVDKVMVIVLARELSTKSNATAGTMVLIGDDVAGGV